MNYLIRTLPAIVFVLFAYYAFAQPPDWADPAKRQMQFKHEEYIVGYASEININNDKHNDIFERLIKNAKADLIESVLVRVRSERRSFAEEANNAFHQKHFSYTSVEAQMDIAGTNVIRHHDINSNTFYVLVYANRDEVYRHYSNRVNNLLHVVGGLIRNANKSYEADYLLDAIKTLNDANVKLFEVQNKIFLLNEVKPSHLQATNKWLIEVFDLQDKVEKRLRQIYSREDNTLRNAVNYLVTSLQGNASDISVHLLLKSFTYENTGRTSSFSDRLNDELTSQLVRTGNYTIIKQKTDSEDHYTVEGTYWDGSNEITIYLSFIGKNNRIKAGSRYFLSKKWLKENNVDYLPDFSETTQANIERPGHEIESTGQYGSIEIKTGFAGFWYIDGVPINYLSENESAECLDVMTGNRLVELKGDDEYFAKHVMVYQNQTRFVFAKSTKPTDNIIQSGRFSDARDGKTYRTVNIGRQTWMAENLAFKPTNGNYWTYKNDESKVDEFGYLYDWQTANNACPRGGNCQVMLTGMN